MVQRNSKAVLVVVVVIILCVASAAAGYFFYSYFRNSDNITPTPVPSSITGDEEVRWNEPQDTGNLGIFVVDESGWGQGVTQSDKYYYVGTVLSGKYKDGRVVVMEGGCYGMCFSPNIYRMVLMSSQSRGSDIYVLKKQSDSLGDGQYMKLNSGVTVDADYELPGLAFPDEIKGLKPRQILKRDSTFRGMFDLLVTNSEKSFSMSQGDVFTSRVQDTTTRNGFYMRAPDGTKVAYKLVVDFVGDDRVPQVTWSGGSRNTDQYNYSDVTGCGSSNYASVVTDTINQTSDLVVAGTNSKGDTIYQLKDTNHKLLKDSYENKYLKDRFTYEEYINSHPMFFWVDPFQRLIKFENAKFVPEAECGKPVIYLYPEHATEVSVYLEPQGGFSYTEPQYDNGWKVLAQPDGTLTEIQSGKQYPYLFWEGRGGIYEQPKKGFVVAQSNVHTFLLSSLTKLGLNTKEIANFVEFWEPRMQGSPYYFVSFLGTQAMDTLAPMLVVPKPDTIIRILMDFSPLNKPVQVEPVQLHSIPREGFTVIEWGGVIR